MINKINLHMARFTKKKKRKFIPYFPLIFSLMPLPGWAHTIIIMNAKIYFSEIYVIVT